MLLVHAALLLTVNNSYAYQGGLDSPGALALLIGGNIGIMMIEGLIVYIQSLRLHLYEFFKNGIKVVQNHSKMLYLKCITTNSSGTENNYSIGSSILFPHSPQEPKYTLTFLNPSFFKDRKLFAARYAP